MSTTSAAIWSSMTVLLLLPCPPPPQSEFFQCSRPNHCLSPPANLPSTTFCLISATPVEIWKITLSSVIVSLVVSCCCCVKRCCCGKSKKDQAETPDGEAALNLEEVMLLSRSLARSLTPCV